MVLKILLSLAFLVAINISDVKEYKIKNKIILPMLVAGLILGIITKSFADCILGMLLPLILFPLYALKMLGAGDVKALCAIGAVVGLENSAMTLIFTFISGGIIAVVFLLVRSNFVSRMKYFFGYLKMCFYTKSIQKYDFGGSSKGYFRFAYAITAGTILMFVNEYVNIVNLI